MTRLEHWTVTFGHGSRPAPKGGIPGPDKVARVVCAKGTSLDEIVRRAAEAVARSSQNARGTVSSIERGPDVDIIDRTGTGS